jgi:hypothetical protein
MILRVKRKEEEPKPMTVQELSSLGGKARAKKLSRERRKEIADNAIAARWSKRKK